MLYAEGGGEDGDGDGDGNAKEASFLCLACGVVGVTGIEDVEIEEPEGDGTGMNAMATAASEGRRDISVEYFVVRLRSSSVNVVGEVGETADFE